MFLCCVESEVVLIVNETVILQILIVIVSVTPYLVKKMDI